MPLREEPLPAVENFSGIIVLSLPSIISTGFLLILVIANRLLGPGQSHAGGSIDEPNAFEIIGGLVFIAVYIACYLGAPIAPIFLPLAAQQAVVLTRLIGLRSRRAIWAWTFVVLGVLASVIYWAWLFHLDELRLEL
jgi:hypothetical protein